MKSIWIKITKLHIPQKINRVKGNYYIKFTRTSFISHGIHFELQGTPSSKKIIVNSTRNWLPLGGYYEVDEKSFLNSDILKNGMS